MISFQIHVQVVAEETRMPLPGLFIKAYDKDLIFDDLLGSAVTGIDGKAEILCQQGDFDEFFDQRPDIYFKVYDGSRKKLIFDSSHSVKWNAGRESFFVLFFPLQKLTGISVN